MKVSIIVPCYNAEKWIEEALLSALNQDYESFEVIFVDNESTDKSQRIAKNVGEKYPNLILASAKNIYKRCWDEPRQEGFRLATGEYLFTLAADDSYEANYVSNCMSFISAGNGKIKAFQSGIRNIGMKAGDSSQFYKTIQQFKDLCLARCPVSSPTVVYSKELFTSGLLETYPDKYSGAADYDLYCRLADNNIFIYPAGRCLGYNYRWHPGQATWEMHRDPNDYEKSIQDYWRNRWNPV
ncbi:MAG TPA: hypothetical protein DCM10_04385 [Xanthomarina gelatinilytica]|nr:hypothetical protein [Xanthomarina gelatinilytica]|tara:strand:+ start:642 stop:1361 length:720 start_codon:yes stop_codon:yes gene_type:complete